MGGFLETVVSGKLPNVKENPAAALKASRPLIRVLVINDNGLWINDFISDNEHRLIYG